MGHVIQIVDPECHLDVESIDDFVDLIFAGQEQRFKITVHQASEAGRSGLRGQHRFRAGWHEIEIFCSEIVSAVERKISVGGNWTVPSDLTHGVYLTLAHELRHAYQHVIHGSGVGGIFRGRYSGRPGEIDARRHVDENVAVIGEFLS